MENLTDLKAILHSKRANIYYLEKCRLMQKAGRVLFLTEEKDKNLFWNIPIANTTVILLGSGTSITHAAVRMLVSAGVLIGFCGTGGTPLLAGSEIEWLSPQSEYRPTEYVQGWMKFWYQEQARLKVAKSFQQARINYIKTTWATDRDLISEGFDSESSPMKELLEKQYHQIDACEDVNQLLLTEALLTKNLYKIAATRTNRLSFVREFESQDLANRFLNHGNYLAYGLAASTLWVLGIPHGFAVCHGKTRRGALVFDVADLIKDALVLPWAFICAKEKMNEQGFRQQCLQNFAKHKTLDYMFEMVKNTSLAIWE